MRTKTEIWLVRHGQSEINVNQSAIYRGANLWSELTDEARTESIQLGNHWKQSGAYFDLWLCSPAVRTQQTCRFCQEGMGIAWPCYELADGFTELSQGEAEGKNHGQYEYAYVSEAEKKPVILTRGGTDEEYWTARLYSKESQKPVVGAESQAEVAKRATEALRRRIEGLTTSPEFCQRERLTVAVFTHENVIKCLLIGLKLHPGPYLKICLPNLSVTKLRYDGNQWELHSEPTVTYQTSSASGRA